VAGLVTLAFNPAASSRMPGDIAMGSRFIPACLRLVFLMRARNQCVRATNNRRIFEDSKLIKRHGIFGVIPKTRTRKPIGLVTYMGQPTTKPNYIWLAH
jgi:hypothetical protein